MTYFRHGYGGQSKRLAVLAKSNDKTNCDYLELVKFTDDTYRSTSSKSIY